MAYFERRTTATKGFLDKIAISDIAAFEKAALAEVDSSLLETIAKEREISADSDKKLRDLLRPISTRF